MLFQGSASAYNLGFVVNYIRIVQESAGVYTFWANVPPWNFGTTLLVSGYPFTYDGSYQGTSAPPVPDQNVVNGQNAGGAFVDVTASRVFTSASPPATTDITGLSTLYQQKPWVAGRVQGVLDPAFPLVNGPIPILNNVGQQTFTCTRTQAGVFSIELPTAHPSGNLPSVQVTHGGAPMFTSYNWGNSRRFGLYFWRPNVAPNAVLTDPDVEFSFMTVP